MNRNELFRPAIESMKRTNQGMYGPVSFQKYLRSNGVDGKRITAPSISIDSYEQLPSLLRDENVMVLRSGVSDDGATTQFVLIKSRDVKDYFIFDQEFGVPGTTYIPDVSMRQLLPFYILPTLSETSLVNLGLASGLIPHALDLASDTPRLVPATAKSVFSFTLRPCSQMDTVIYHKNGQVEIDSVVLDVRQGKPTLFVIEAKSNNYQTLAKHKLVYPIMAVAERVPKDIQIVPVYIRILKKQDGIEFSIMECCFPDPRTSCPALDDLQVVSHKRLILPLVRGI